VCLATRIRTTNKSISRESVRVCMRMHGILGTWYHRSLKRNHTDARVRTLVHDEFIIYIIYTVDPASART